MLFILMVVILSGCFNVHLRNKSNSSSPVISDHRKHKHKHKHDHAAKDDEKDDWKFKNSYSHKPANVFP